MDQELKANKQIIRQFMKVNYTDERLAMLLAHAQSGKLAYFSCCCFIGIPTADHALRETFDSSVYESHIESSDLPNEDMADAAYCRLANPLTHNYDTSADERRRRRLIPIIKAEIRRRDRARQAIAVTADAYALTL